jgi:hypothetical protein
MQFFPMAQFAAIMWYIPVAYFWHSLQQVCNKYTFLYANFSSGTLFVATLWHTPAACFWHTFSNNITANTEKRSA